METLIHLTRQPLQPCDRIFQCDSGTVDVFIVKCSHALVKLSTDDLLNRVRNFRLFHWSLPSLDIMPSPGVVGNFERTAGDQRPPFARDFPETGFLMNGSERYVQ